jgi:hypothetical protein
MCWWKTQVRQSYAFPIGEANVFLSKCISLYILSPSNKTAYIFLCLRTQCITLCLWPIQATKQWMSYIFLLRITQCILWYIRGCLLSKQHSNVYYRVSFSLQTTKQCKTSRIFFLPATKKNAYFCVLFPFHQQLCIHLYCVYSFKKNTMYHKPCVLFRF